MTEIKFKKDCSLNGNFYFENDIWQIKDIKKEDLPTIWKLNEKGFIYPLTLKDFIQFEKEIENKNKFNTKKEDNEKWQD